MKKALSLLMLTFFCALTSLFGQGIVEITITPESSYTDYEFDGELHTLTTYNVTSGALRPNEFIVAESVEMDTAYLRPGTYDVRLKNTVRIEDIHHNDVTSTYNITYDPGTLVIAHRGVKYKIQPQTQSAQNPFTGELQTLDGFLTTSFMVSGHTYTLSGLTAHAEGVNVGTYPMMVSGTPVIKLDTIDVTSEFEVEIDTLNLKITQHPLAIVVDTIRPYDGAPFVVDYTKLRGVLVDGDSFTAGEFTTTGSDVGTYRLNETTVRCTQDVQTSKGIENYLVTYSIRQEIDRLHVVDTVRGNSATADYDGTTHSVSGYTLSSSSPLYSQSYITQPSVAPTASRMTAGTTSMGLRATQFSNTNNNFDVSFHIIDGYVKINQIGTIQITSATASKTYDGTPLTNDGYTYTGTLVSGDVLSATVIGTITNAGVVNNVVSEYQIMHGSVDVTDSYIFDQVIEGKLTVMPVDIYVTTADSIKMYDGTPLENHRFTMTGTFVDADSIRLYFTGSQLEQGESFNGYEPIYLGTTNPGNYLIHNVFGKLKVVDSLKLSVATFRINCYGQLGNADVYARYGHEGMPPYQYKLDDGEWQTTNSPGVFLNGLSASSHKLVMVDNIGIRDSVDFELHEPAAPLTIDTIRVTNTPCADKVGQAVSEISGGTPVHGDGGLDYYLYYWMDGTDTISIQPFIKNLPAGNYTLYVQDDYGCRTSKDFEIGVSRYIDIRDFSLPFECSKSGSGNVVPQNSIDGYVPEGTVYTWDAPTITPASAASQVAGWRTGTEESSISTGLVQNNSGVAVLVTYTVYPSLDPCCPIEKNHPFTVTLSIGGDDVEHESISISANSLSVCSNIGLTDTVLEVDLSGLSVMDNYVLNWSSDNFTHRSHTLPRGATRDTIHITLPDVCYGSYLYNLSMADSKGCVHLGSGRYYVQPGTWSVPADPAVREVQCVTQASVPHLLSPSERPVVITSCGDEIVPTYSGYAEGEPCDMMVHHLYVYKDCRGTVREWETVYHVKDNQPPTVKPDYSATLRASVLDCVFSIPSLIDSLMPVSDNCGGALWYSQDPAPGTVIEHDTDVVVTLSDFCNNITTATFRIVVDDTLDLEAEDFDSHCYNVNDGYVLGSFTGGVAPYDLVCENTDLLYSRTYNSTGSFSFEDLPDGTYNIYVHSANGCVSTKTVEVEIQDRDELLEVTANTTSRVYDGTVLKDTTFSITQGALVPGDSIAVSITGSRTNVGTTQNHITDIRIYRDGVDVTCEYNLSKVDGTLTVNKRSVTLKSATATKMYDGTALEDHTVSITAGSFVAGQGIDSYSVTGTQTYVGHSENHYTYTLLPGTDPNNYNITTQYGVLTVSKVNTPLVIKASDSTKVYDGTALVQPRYEYTSGVLIEGDVLEVTTTGSQTPVGVGYNTIDSYRIMRGTQDVTNCYTISPCRIGTLNVTQRGLTITAGSKLNIPYNGDEHTWEEIPGAVKYTITSGSLAPTDTLTNVVLSGAGTLVGNHPTYVELSSIVIKDKAAPGTNLKENYAINVVNGNLQIIDHMPPYPIILIAHSDTIQYDGADHTCSGYDTVVLNGVTTVWDHTQPLTVTLINEVGNPHIYTITGLTASRTERNANTYPVNITGTPTILDITSADVTAQFEIIRKPGTFVIQQADALTINVVDTKPYDGTKLTTAYNKAGTTTTGNMAAHDALSAGAVTTETPAIGEYHYTSTTPWSSQISTAYNTTGGISNYVTVIYNVTQKITKGNTMTVTCPTGTSIKKVYDGTPLQPAATASANVHDGTPIIIEYSTDGGANWSVFVPEITHCAESPLNVQVRACHPYYDTVYCNYTLTITTRPVTLTSATASKEYDQTDLTAPTITVGGSGFAPGEGLSDTTVTGRIRNVVDGSASHKADNPFTYTLKSNTAPTDYTFNTVVGKLWITPRPVTITSADSTRTYQEDPTHPVEKHFAKVTSAKGFLGGDTVSYTSWGSQLIPGYSPNNFAIAGFTPGADPTSTKDNYSITLKKGTLMVTDGDALVVSSQNDTFQYNGLPHYGTKFTATLNGVVLQEVPSSGGLSFYVYGDGTDPDRTNILSITPTASIINVEESPVHSTFNYNISYGSQSISSCYTVTKLDTGKLYVTPIPLTITVNATKEYDNTKLSTAYNSSDLTATGFATGTGVNDRLTAGKITTDMDTVHTYTYDNNVSNGLNSTITTAFVIKNASNQVINTNYEITYIVNQTITPSDDYNLYCPGTTNNAQTITKTYDGDSLKATAIVTGQYAGDVFRIQYSVDNGTTWSDLVPRILHVSENKTILVRASHHDYVTKDCSYDLTINKRNVKPTSATDTKVYDHVALTNSTVTTPTTGSYLPWVSGEEPAYTVTGSQTEVGSHKNDFDFTWNANAVQNDYIVTLDSGLLTVTPSPKLEVYCPGTTINDVDVTKTYDGTALNPVATFNNTGLYGSDAASVVIEYNYGSGWTTTQPSITHYVQSPLNVQVRATHPDYQTATCDYVLTINKRPITITSADSTQVYDGTENRKEVTEVTYGSFVTGESFVYSDWTGRTHLGTQNNSFKFAPGASTDTNDYAVTLVYGTLEITPSPLAVVTCPSGNAITKMYDGTPLAPTASAMGIGTDVVPVQYATSASGPWQNTPISITNVGTQHVYVRTNNPDYQVQTCDYELTDTCRHITLTSQDSTRKYTATALNAHRVTVSEDGFATGESFTYTAFPSPVDSGIYSNTFTYAAGTGTSLSNYCVTQVNGTLTITRSDDRSIDCPSTVEERTHTYDGTLFSPAVTASGITGSGDVFQIEYSYNGSTGWTTTPLGLTDAGTQHVYVRATNNNYDTITCDYELEVVCRPITLTSGTEYRTYDGTTWNKPTVSVGGDGLVSGQAITYSDFPSIKVVDTISNTFNYSFDAPALATNYCVTPVYGNIGVKPATLSVECPGTTENPLDVTKMYDGTKLDPAADTSGLYAGDVATLAYSVDNGATWSDTVPYITHVGTKDVKVRATHHDYDTAYCDYTLEITCRHLTLTSGSKSLFYDGTTWDYQSVTITGDGMADGEHIDSTDFTTIQNVGTKENEFTYTFRSPAQAGDYCVDHVYYGTLEVKKADFNVECPGTTANPATLTKVYDGTPLQPAADTSGLFGSDVATIEYSTDGGTTWSSAVPSITNTGVLHVNVRATNSNYNDQTCSYNLEITPYTVPVVVEIVGHHNLFNYDTYEHAVGGFDTTCADALYAAVMDTSFSFTGVDSVRRTAIGLDSLEIVAADFSNHNPNFTDVTFIVKKGWIEIKDVIKPVFIVGCSDLTIPSPIYPNEGPAYRHSGTDWDAQATDNYAFDSLYYLLSGATVRTVPVAQIESLDGQLFHLGTTVVTWIAKDEAGNDTTCTFTVTVIDNLAPEVICPKDTLVMCYGDIPAGASTYAEFVVLGGSATDVGSGIDYSTFSMSASAFDGVPCQDTLRRTYSVFDVVGNEGNCVHKIAIKDTIKPTFTAPADLDLCRNDVTGEIEAPISVTGDVSDEADNCSTGLNATWADSDTTLTDADDRVIHRVWTLVDDCGNTTEKIQNITIHPSIKTAGNVDITCPNDTTVVLDYGRCDTAILLPSPAFANHMTGSNVVVSKDIPDDHRYAAETTTDVTWTFTDDCGATQICVQKVTIHYPPCGGILDSVDDADGFRYSSVRIGCYCWTGENLRSTKYSDGTPIANYTSYNNSDSLENLYGKLYSWYSAARVTEGDDTEVPVDSVGPHGNYIQGICPQGWALPTLDEYMQMISDAGDQLEKVKDADQRFWYDGYAGTLPNSGFDARGGGKYDAETGAYQDLLVGAYFWTTTNTSNSMMMISSSIPSTCSPIEVISTDKNSGLSIRCIRKK